MSTNPEQEDPKWEMHIPFTRYKICTSSRFWYRPPPIPMFRFGIVPSIMFCAPVFALSFIPIFRSCQEYIMFGTTSIISCLTGASAEWRLGSADIASPVCAMFHFSFMMLMKYKLEYLKSYLTSNIDANGNSEWFIYAYLYWWYLFCCAMGTGFQASGPYRSPVGLTIAMFDNMIFGGWQRLISIVKRDYNGSPRGRNYWTLSILILLLHGFIAKKCATELYQLYWR